MSHVRMESRGRGSVFDITTPIPGAGGTPQGEVRATVSTGSILADVLRVSLGQTGESYLVDGAGTFLAHKEPSRILRENIAQSESFSQIFGKTGRKSVYTDYRGIAVLGASRPVAGTDWFLVVEQDRDEAFAPSQQLKRKIYVVIAVSAAMVVFASWLLGYYVTAPVRKLSEAARSLAAGEFDHALAGASTERHDEIGQLYAAFADMARRLREHHYRLERRVGFTEEELRKADARLQNTLEAAARSEHLAALGRLASGVAHEIRTPLASLKLFLQSCREDMEDSPEDREDFCVAMRQVHRIEATINHFLQFARPREPVMTVVDFQRLVDEALEIVRPRAKQQNVAVVSSVAENLPRVEGDLRQLSECLVNLMVNALDVMACGGELQVLVREASPDNGEQGVRIDVSDTGPGIAPENLDRLFEPFFTTKAAGSGLGLPIVQNTVRSHGGVVRVRTIPGAGTTFSIHLPAAS
jgi:signal transduction histidine kinase